MENLAPSLRLLLAIRWGIEKGQSCRKSFLDYLETEEELKWRHHLETFLKDLDQGLNPWPQLGEIPETRRAVLLLIEKGLRGHSIYTSVCQLEFDLWQMSESELQRFAAALPMKGLLPLFLFQFPSLLILILGPLIFGVIGDL